MLKKETVSYLMIILVKFAEWELFYSETIPFIGNCRRKQTGNWIIDVGKKFYDKETVKNW